jgi:hypothetical protein
MDNRVDIHGLWASRVIGMTIVHTVMAMQSWLKSLQSTILVVTWLSSFTRRSNAYTSLGSSATKLPVSHKLPIRMDGDCRRDACMHRYGVMVIQEVVGDMVKR